MKLRRVVSVLAVILASGVWLAGQPAGVPPNPYTTAGPWGTLPQGRTWGAVSGVDVDRDGSSIWVAERCGAEHCGNSTLAPILELDANGAVVASFGAGMFAVPHGIHVDREGNVWVTDASDGADAPAAKGHQVFKFSPDGKLLLTLGKAGVRGSGPDTFNRPTPLSCPW